MARDRRRSKLSHRDLVAELDADLVQAAGAGGIALALFHLREVTETLAEAERRWRAAQARARKARRILDGLAIPPGRYGRQVARAIGLLRTRLEPLAA